MPRKLRQPKHRARPARLSDFPFHERWRLISSWFPPRSWEPWRANERWQTWTDFLADYELVRDEVLRLFPPARLAHRRAGVPFAEAAWRFRKEYGAAALDAASYDELRNYPPYDGDEAT